MKNEKAVGKPQLHEIETVIAEDCPSARQRPTAEVPVGFEARVPQQPYSNIWL